MNLATTPTTPRAHRTARRPRALAAITGLALAAAALLFSAPTANASVNDVKAVCSWKAGEVPTVSMARTSTTSISPYRSSLAGTWVGYTYKSTSLRPASDEFAWRLSFFGNMDLVDRTGAIIGRAKPGFWRAVAGSDTAAVKLATPQLRNAAGDVKSITFTFWYQTRSGSLGVASCTATNPA